MTPSWEETNSNLVRNLVKCEQIAVKLKQVHPEEKPPKPKCHVKRSTNVGSGLVINQLQKEVTGYQKEYESLSSKYITLTYRYEEALADYIQAKKDLKKEIKNNEEQKSSLCLNCPKSNEFNPDYSVAAGLKRFYYKSEKSNTSTSNDSEVNHDLSVSYVDQLLQSINDVIQREESFDDNTNVQSVSNVSLQSEQTYQQTYLEPSSNIEASPDVAQALSSDLTVALSSNSSTKPSEATCEVDIDRSDDLFAGGLKFICFIAQHCRICNTTHKSDVHRSLDFL